MVVLATESGAEVKLHLFLAAFLLVSSFLLTSSLLSLGDGEFSGK